LTLLAFIDKEGFEKHTHTHQNLNANYKRRCI